MESAAVAFPLIAAMLVESPQPRRALREETIHADLVIVGGGLAGVCGAITAAREGLRVALVQDRPVLGGNASSEVRLWVLGATAHGGNNNRWAREGGVIDELLVENMWRNPEGNALIFDALLLEKVTAEPNIRLLLNCAVFDLAKSHPDRIDSVRAFCSQNATMYDMRAPLFCDASGDGIVGFLAGAAFRMGAESREEFGEKLAPDAEYGTLLGQSIYFYSKDTGRPVEFIAPGFALDDIGRIPRYRSFNARDFGCRLWWIEYGGRLDTVHDTEQIKWELWKVVYGVWNHIKNSGHFPEAATLTLEWVGHIPGKRESRRFEGDYLLRQQDIVERPRHADAVAFGGWSIDLHPADGVFSEKPGCMQLDSRGIYSIPFRCLYSRNLANLFLAGRLISATHVAFASARVMATCAHAAQAVGCAAALCLERGIDPPDITARPWCMAELQTRLLRNGQHIPRLRLADPDDLARRATVSASSELSLASLPPDGPPLPLDVPRVQLLPVTGGPLPTFSLLLDVTSPTVLQAELRVTRDADDFTPAVVIAALSLDLRAGANQTVTLAFDARVDGPQYVFLCLGQNALIAVRTSEQRVSGLVVLSPRSWHAFQNPPQDVGVDSFEIWCPARRPDGQNFALTVEPPIAVYPAANVTNGVQRPTPAGPNAWVAAFDDAAPALTLEWAGPQKISRIELFFDTDLDHPMESVLMGHPERAMPYCVRHYRILTEDGVVCFEQRENHQTRNVIRLPRPMVTTRLRIELLGSHGPCPAELFEVRCY